MEASRRLVKEGKWAIEGAKLEGSISPDAAGEARSALADAAISALLPHVTAEFVARHGAVKGGQLAVIALGKLGGREMLPGSDLDTILVSDQVPDVVLREA